MSRRLFWLSVLAVLAGIVAVYGQTWSFEFLSYDDEGYTVKCPFVAGGLSAANISAALRDPAWGGIWMPVTYASYMAGISLFGPSAGAHHAVSVFFHCAAALLFMVFLVRLHAALAGGSDRGHRLSPFVLFAAAALWAWHPLRVESVAWVASRKDALFTVFSLAGLVCWIRVSARAGVRAAGSPLFPAPGACVAAWLMMALGCMSKPTAMVFPALAFSVELLFAGFALFVSPRRWVKYVPLLAVTAAVGALAAYSQTHATGEAAHPLFYSTFSWRILNAAVSLGLYLFRTVVPAGLQFWYRPVRGGVPLHAAAGLVSLSLAAAAVAAAAGFCRARARSGKACAREGGAAAPGLVLASCTIWFLAALSPTLGIAGSFGNHALADRFTYVPSMAFSIAVALSAGGMRRRCAAAVTAVLAAFAALSFRYAATYRNNLTAFENVARHDPEHCYAWNNIGSETILRTGDLEKGISLFRKSLAIFPTDEAKEELAFALVSRNDPADEAEIVSICLEGLDAVGGKPIPVIPAEKDPGGFRSEALGTIAVRHRDWPNAIICFETAFSRAPEREDCRMRLAMSLWNARRRDEARVHLAALSRSARPDIAAKARELLAIPRD